VPQAEVADKARTVQAHGSETRWICLIERDAKYFDFKPGIHSRQGLMPAIEDNTGLVAQGKPPYRRFRTWWAAHSIRITALAGHWKMRASLVALRATCSKASASRSKLSPARPVPGTRIVAGFWYQTKYDFLTP